MVGEERRHLLGRLQILLKRIAHTVRIVQIAARIEADQVVVRHGILGEDEVHVVRTDIPDAEFCRQSEDRLVDPKLVFVDVGVLLRVARRVQLHFEVVILAENPLEPLNDTFGLSHVVAHDRLRQFAAQAGRAANQPFVIVPQQLLVHARLVVESLGEGVGDHLAEVVVAFEVFGQQDQVVAGLLVLVLLEAVFHHVDLAAEDGLDAQLGGRVVEVLHAVHVAVVGDRQRRHPERFGALEKRLDGRGSVENGVLKMDEIGHMWYRSCKSLQR